ncbi:amidohydrolase family protein [Chloroflexota bacterium]
MTDVIPDILIEGGIVLTMNSEWKIFPDGAVVVQGDRIIEVGNTDDLRKKYPTAKRVIDAKNKLVMPGLIDSHDHLHHGILKGMVPGNYGYGDPWMIRVGELYMTGQYTEERAYLAVMMTCIESIRAGTTTLMECGTPTGREDMHAKAIVDSGLRGILGIRGQDVFGPPGFVGPKEHIKLYGATAEKNIERIEGVIQKYNNTADGRLGIWPCLIYIQNASDKLCRMCKELADKYKVGLNAHANVMRLMVEASLQGWGKTPIMRLYDAGALGQNVLLVHAAVMPGQDMIVLKETNTSLSHCPLASMGLGYGACLFGHFPEMLEMGINVAIGTDAQTCGNHKDMVRVMNATFLAHKEAKFNNNLWPPKTVVEMATRNGAKALGMESEIGSLEPGKKADIILFDLTRPEWVPVNRYNLIENLVLSATGDSVDTSIINGKVVMEGRAIKTFDMDKIVTAVQKEGEVYFEGFDFTGTDKPYPENLPPLW